MSTAGYPRWAISLADLTLLLLGFSVLLYASTNGAGHQAGKMNPAVQSASSILFRGAAAPLFAGGEARLTPRARARLKIVGNRAAGRKTRVQILSSGSAPGSARFDRWELAAARTAAVARALNEGGLAEDRIDLVIPPLPAEAGGDGQRIEIRTL